MNPEILRRNPHLKKYIKKFEKKFGKRPIFLEVLTFEMKDIQNPNVIYPVGDPIFIHVFVDENMQRNYVAIEPKIEDEKERKLYDEILTRILEKAPDKEVTEDLEKAIEDIFNEVTVVNGKKTGFLSRFLMKKIPITKEQKRKFLYLIKRDVVRLGPLEPLIRDPYIEDIHVIGARNIYLVHKIFGTTRVLNIDFKDDLELAKYLKTIGERIGRPPSEARPIVDATLPDGSRINIIYSTDVSLKGPSFTIRKFTAKPLSIVQLVAWNTLSSEIAAYLWLCLEYGMSGFICGETASGKTTTLNAILVFVPPDKKIYTAEDTAEVRPPHKIWQQLLTRERGKEEERVTLFDLLKAALRSRPNYIIVGEIRGAEAAVAFQAMQCIKECKVVFGDDLIDIKDLFERYKKKYGVKIRDNKEIVEIKEDVKIPAYDEKKGIVYAKLKAIVKMPKTKLIRIILDDGNYLEVTPNHKFITNLGELSAETILKLYRKRKIYIKRIKSFEKIKNIKLDWIEETINIDRDNDLVAKDLKLKGFRGRKRVKYIRVDKKDFEKVIKDIWLSGITFSTDLIRGNIRIIYFDDREYSRVISAEYCDTNHTYDLVLEGAKYYLGGNYSIIPIEDTGHPVLATFHASSVKRVIQRLTGEPINVPVRFIDNLNFVLIQQAVYLKGKLVRRVTSISEIEGFSEELGGVITRTVFEWDPYTDRHMFKGLYNSYILENKIAPLAGYSDTRQIYEELYLRAKIIEEMVRRKIFDYEQVTKIIWDFYRKGLSGLPFRI